MYGRETFTFHGPTGRLGGAACRRPPGAVAPAPLLRPTYLVGTAEIALMVPLSSSIVKLTFNFEPSLSVVMQA